MRNNFHAGYLSVGDFALAPRSPKVIADIYEPPISQVYQQFCFKYHPFISRIVFVYRKPTSVTIGDLQLLNARLDMFQ